MTALFSSAMALREVDAEGVYRVFAGELNKHYYLGFWLILGGMGK